MILQGDVLEQLKTLDDESVHCVVTSPPYWGLRDYGVQGQLGMEKTPEEFIVNMVAVFREVRRVLRSDGTLWLNIGDSYASNRKGGLQGKNGARADRRFTASTQPKMSDGLKDKDLVGIPWMLAFALRADGWYLRQDIIWMKPNPVPESVRDRCTKSHEYIFLLAKSAKYYFDADAIKEPSIYKEYPQISVHGHGDEPRNSVDLMTAKHRKNQPKGSFNGKTGRTAFRKTGEYRNKRDVWKVASKPYKEAHFATFPPDLITPCVLAGAPLNGVVLDPFMGSGTTAAVAKMHGREWVGIELNPEYVKLAERRIASVIIKP